MEPRQTLAEYITKVGVEQAKQETWLVHVLPADPKRPDVWWDGQEVCKTSLADLSPTGRWIGIGAKWHTTDRVELVEKMG